MTTPIPDPTDQLLTQIRGLARDWRQLRRDDSAGRAALLDIGDTLAKRVDKLDDGLRTGTAYLPGDWTAAVPQPPTPAAPGTPVDDAAQEAAAAEQAYNASRAAAVAALTEVNTAGRVLGNKRRKYYDLARENDLSRP